MSNQKTNVEDGWSRYYVKSSGALTRDISVFSDDEFQDQIYKVDGKMFKKTAKIFDAMDTVILKAETTKTVPMKVKYTNTDGVLVANLDADSPLKKKYMTIGLVGGDEWVVEGDHANQNYTVFEDGKPIVKMRLGSLLSHKRFSVDISDGVDTPLVIGVAWALNLAILQRIAGAGGAIAAV